jgi:curved DNA-binding protein CbpA
MIYHPDANHPSASTDNFMSLRNAYNLLKDESSRVRYNRTGVGWNASASSSSGGGGMGTNWNDELMKEQIRRRAYGPHRSSSSSAWGSGRGEAGYSQARWGGTAGDSDYGFAGYAHAGPDTGNRRGNYTSNVRFIGSVAIVVSRILLARSLLRRSS